MSVLDTTHVLYNEIGVQKFYLTKRAGQIIIIIIIILFS